MMSMSSGPISRWWWTTTGSGRAEPGVSVYWYYLADAQVKAGDFEGALNSAARGMALSVSYPEPERYRLIQGRALTGLGETHGAVEVFSSVIDSWDTGKTPDVGVGRWIQAEILYGRGEAYRDLGDEARARADWERARELRPDWDRPARALARLDLAGPARMISNFLAENLSAGGPDATEKFVAWAETQELPGGGRLAVNAVVPENNFPGRAAPRVLLVDWAVRPQPPAWFQAHGVYWWTDGLLHAEVQLYSVDADRHGFGQYDALIQARQMGNQVAVIYDTAAFGSGSPRPVLCLWRLDRDGWEILWRSDAVSGWRNSHGNICFTGPGLDEFTLESDSWLADDGKDNIFHEANAGPHRQFMDTWTLRNDGYELKKSRTLPSAYNTLVELVYALSTGRTAAAKKLVTDGELVERAKRLGLVQEPFGQGWMLSFDDPQALQSGPLTITDGPATGVRVTFTQRDGRWLISGLGEPKEPKK